jgi:type I restriction enzyme S subunit
VSVAEDQLRGGNVTRGIVPIRFDPAKIDQLFGFYQFFAAPVRDQIESATYGAALRQINISDVRKIELVTPPLDVQRKISRRVEQADAETGRLVQAHQDKLRQLVALKQSILRRAFAGELTSAEDIAA